MWTANDANGQPRGRAGEVHPSDGTDQPRLYYLDNLRLLLIVLVVVHHASQPYGPADWWYVEDADGSPVLSTLSTVSGAFRMSLLFFVSAFLLPRSYDRKGGLRFLAERFRQFVPPILAGFLVLIPVLMYAYYLNFRDYGPIGFAAYYTDVYLGAGQRPDDWSGPIWPDRQFGHLWFLQHLLVYAVLYTAWRGAGSLAAAWRSPRNPSSPRVRPGGQAPGTAAIAVFILVVSVATFVLRGWYPVDRWVPVLEFIQAEPADLAQYTAFFVLGILAYRRGWLSAFSARAGYVWLGAGSALAAAHFVAEPWLGGVYATGGWNAGSLLWSTTETLMSTALSIGLLIAFREWVAGPSRLVRALAPVAFTVYVLHVPVVVALQYAVSGAPAGPLAAFGVVAAVGVVAGFALAWCVRRIPYLRALV
ncbi:acyltransferase family protein [Streptomonospora wellingtoniae]|uniref:Acyltransferase family protein n=1 Tax=Streptomonospora wellingtoniae TaxID=3075544 RepID=A0ABU2L0X9_9ACTN|nr:acyltransferase family protein [Streptomonospora sp. DSM 45055]MDT0305200.1 acyltransferase family protein [Streptomonospora sp. DSM 45055]